MDIQAFSIQESFIELGMLLLLFFALLHAWLLRDLIKHMRQMVRLKYHSDDRAEFDESRVKIVLAIVFLVWVMYLAGLAYSAFALDTSKQNDSQLATRIIGTASVCLLICSYALYYVNNRIQSDIKHIKKVNPYRHEDKSQDITRHL